MSKIGDAKAATFEDFGNLKRMCICHDDWVTDYSKGNTQVWTKSNNISSFKMIKIQGKYPDVSAAVLYDVLHDPVYRKSWDPSMIEGKEICKIDDYSDIGYYSLRLPKPLANRDFVTTRSWKDDGKEKYIINHSVNHSTMPIKKSFIRGLSYITGYFLQAHTDDPSHSGVTVTYITQSDPKGNLPSWAVNKATQWLAPKVIKRLHKACIAYPDWKKSNDPDKKSWLFPEQCLLPVLSLSDILPISENDSDSQKDMLENEDKAAVVDETQLENFMRSS